MPIGGSRTRKTAGRTKFEADLKYLVDFVDGRFARESAVTYKLRMAKRPKTSFDNFVDEQMRSSSFANTYVNARAEIDAVDRIVRVIDKVRRNHNMTKAALARAAGMRPEILRRLFTATDPNPTLETIVRVMAVLGQTLTVVPLPRARSVRRPLYRT